MANIPLKWGIIGTDGKVEINGADDSAFISSSPAFKVNGDGTVTGAWSVGGNLSVSGNLTVSGNETFDGKLTINNVIQSQPGSGATYIGGCAGNSTGLFVKKDSLNSSHWIPGITIQTNGGGGWAIGNYNNEYLEFAYGTKANIDSTTNQVSRFILGTGDPNTAYEIITQKNLQDNMTSRNAGTSTTSSYLLSKAADGTSSLDCIKNAFSSVNKSTGLAVRLQHGSHSMAFGWFLSGYDYAHAYGGFFVSDYDVPRWVGVSNGTWRSDSFFTSKDTIPISNGGTGATTAANARTNLGLGSAATYNASASTAANQVALRDGNGDCSFRYAYTTHVNISAGDQTDNADYNGYTIYANADGWLRKIPRANPLYTGTLTAGNQATLTNGIHYSSLVVRVRPTSDGSYVSVTIPCRGLSTSAIRHQGADETNYTTFDIWQSGNNVIIKTINSNGGGYIARVEGMG